MSEIWSEIVFAHAELVTRCVRRIVGNDQDCEDVVQDVFFEAYRISHESKISNWAGFLRQLATRRAIDCLRKRITRKAQLQHVELTEIANVSREPHEIISSQELAEQLRIAITKLPERQAEIFSLRYFEELTYEQIGDALSMTSNAVGIALSKARSRLQELLRGDLKSEEQK